MGYIYHIQWCRISSINSSVTNWQLFDLSFDKRKDLLFGGCEHTPLKGHIWHSAWIIISQNVAFLRLERYVSGLHKNLSWSSQSCEWKSIFGTVSHILPYFIFIQFCGPNSIYNHSRHHGQVESFWTTSRITNWNFHPTPRNLGVFFLMTSWEQCSKSNLHHASNKHPPFWAEDLGGFLVKSSFFIAEKRVGGTWSSKTTFGLSRVRHM